MWKGKVWAGSNKPEVQTAEHGAAFCSLSHLSQCCATWHSNLGTTSARFFFFFLPLQCSAIIILRKVLKALNAELYLPFLTGSLAHSHQTKDNGKCLNFALALVFGGAVGMPQRLSEQGNQFD